LETYVLTGLDKTAEWVFAAIDPGKSGAVGVIYSDGRTEAWHSPLIVTRKTTSAKLKSGKRKGQNVKRRTEKRQIDLAGRMKLLAPFAKMAREGKNVLVTLEQVSSMPRDGKVQAFSFGYDFGTWEMALVALRLPYKLVRPNVWRPEMVGEKADKNESLKLCRRLYPKLSLPLAKDEARAEAILIADWQRRRELGLEMPRQRKATKIKEN